MELSLVIPAFNEAQRIGPTLRCFHRFLAVRPASFEILVVDDGSADDTVALVRALAGELPGLRVLCSPVNRGKGHAVRRGMLAATGRGRLFSDADGSTPSGKCRCAMVTTTAAKPALVNSPGRFSTCTAFGSSSGKPPSQPAAVHSAGHGC